VGCFPRLAFDRREVILPPVPLNITSVCSFFIINDGYESLQLNHNFILEYEQLDLSINYVNGQSIGVQNNKIKVEVQFVSAKAISFTGKLEFYDENVRTYSIFVLH